MATAFRMHRPVPVESRRPIQFSHEPHAFYGFPDRVRQRLLLHLARHNATALYHSTFSGPAGRALILRAMNTPEGRQYIITHQITNITNPRLMQRVKNHIHFILARRNASGKVVHHVVRMTMRKRQGR